MNAKTKSLGNSKDCARKSGVLQARRPALCSRRMWTGALIGFVGLAGPLFAQNAGQPAVNLAAVEKAVAALKTLAQGQVDANAVPGLAVAVVYEDKLLYAGGFGAREAGLPARVDADTVFQLASVSKPIGATVVAGLIGQKKITWDSKLSELDPAFAMSDAWVTREITLRDMYAHRSGLPGHAGDLLEDLGYGRAEVLHRLRFLKPAAGFRAGYAYTNFGLTEAAVAAAGAHGLDWADASEKILYQPLGMRSTSSRFADFQARTNKAPGHVWQEGRWVHRAQRNPDAQSPAGGVSSSVNDLSRWMRLQMGEGTFEGRPVIEPAPLAETQFPQIITGSNHFTGAATFYGMGWDISYDEQARVRLNHSGAFAMGASTRVSLVPRERLGVVVLTNAAPIGVAEGLTAEFIETALYGKSSREWLPFFKHIFADPATIGVEVLSDYGKPPVPGTEPAKNGAYAGTYGNNALFGDIRIAEQAGRLVLIIGPQKLALALTHYDRDTFTFQTVGENAAGLSGVTFAMGADGKAMRVVIESLDKQGQGTFARQ